MESEIKSFVIGLDYNPGQKYTIRHGLNSKNFIMTCYDDWGNDILGFLYTKDKNTIEFKPGIIGRKKWIYPKVKFIKILIIGE